MCVFSSSSRCGCTGGVHGCPPGAARLRCQQSRTCPPGCGCASLSWTASCRCAAKETERDSDAGGGAGDPGGPPPHLAPTAGQRASVSLSYVPTLLPRDKARPVERDCVQRLPRAHTKWSRPQCKCSIRMTFNVKELRASHAYRSRWPPRVTWQIPCPLSDPPR